MKEEKKDHFIVITPADSKVLYNGVTLSECVYLPLGVDTSTWEEITQTKAKKIKKALEEEHEKEQETRSIRTIDETDAPELDVAHI